MTTGTPTLEDVRSNLDELREVANRTYAKHPSRPESPDGWTLENYLAGIDELEQAIVEAMAIAPCSSERLAAEKFARNVLAVRLYFRGRLCPKTGALGRFYKKNGDKKIHWVPTELSRQADRLAAEPLRQIYKATEACLGGK